MAIQVTAVASSLDLPRVTLGAEVGFQWLPFRQIGLYLNPCIGAGYGSDLGGHTYAAGLITPLFGIHLGYGLKL